MEKYFKMFVWTSLEYETNTLSHLVGKATIFYKKLLFNLEEALNFYVP